MAHRAWGEKCPSSQKLNKRRKARELWVTCALMAIQELETKSWACRSQELEWRPSIERAPARAVASVKR